MIWLYIVLTLMTREGEPEHGEVNKEVVVGFDNKVGLGAVVGDPMVPQDSFVRQVPEDGGDWQ